MKLIYTIRHPYIQICTTALEGQAWGDGMASLTTAIGAKDAIWIATKFLEQHHCVICADASLEGKEWIVTAKTGVLSGQIKYVWVDASTGRITRCS